MRTPLIVLAVLCFLLPVWASEPGQPLTANDWEFLDTSFSVEVWAERDEACLNGAPNLEPVSCSFGNLVIGATEFKTGQVTDVSGSIWAYRRAFLGGSCGFPGDIRGFWDLLRCASSTSCNLVARIPFWRCIEQHGQSWDLDESAIVGLWIDNMSGYLYVRLVTSNAGQAHYSPGEAVHRFVGLPTTFEILETYIPTTNEISFRVPYMPEGFQFADHFDTYYGDLTTVGDWSQAQPLQCGYPATAPSVGDYLTVADTLPESKPGQGRYYVTAVTHQGETRYGRKSGGAVPAGRDPAVLPECAE